MLIYGSTAIQHWFPATYLKTPKDLDIISRDASLKKPGVEVYWTDAFRYLTRYNKDKQYVDPDLLYTIKVSHAAWDINWVKHTMDIQFLRMMGCKLVPEFYFMLIEDWTKIHGAKNLDFNKPHKELFMDSVNRKYGHDELHEALKMNDTPMYKMILKEQDKALCDYELFKALSSRKKLELAMEEVVVVAYERYVIPQKMPLKYAINKALQDLVTRMTKGWFNLYLIENSDSIIRMGADDFNYFLAKGSKLCQ